MPDAAFAVCGSEALKWGTPTGFGERYPEPTFGDVPHPGIARIEYGGPAPDGADVGNAGLHSTTVARTLAEGETEVSSPSLDGLGLWKDPGPVEDLLAGPVEAYGVVPSRP